MTKTTATVVIFLAAALAVTGLGCGGNSSPNVAASSHPVSTASQTAPQPDYSGTGTQTLPPISFSHGVTAKWTNTGTIFFLIALKPTTIPNPQLIVSQAKSGTSYIQPGNYLFKVSTDSDSSWTVTFR
jgi:hypothetical protein